MSLSKQSIDTLLDLVEIKLSCFEVWDRDDRRELKALQACKAELQQARAPQRGGKAAEVVALDRKRSRQLELAG